MDSDHLKQGVRFLAEAGLNLFTAVSLQDLPPQITTLMRQANVPLADYQTLVIIGHGGKTLWQQMTADDWAEQDPIDSYSQRHADLFIKTYLDDAPSLALFPTGYLIPLQQLGEFVGWSYPTPLGVGINPTFGVWFAYRAAFLTTAVFPTIHPPIHPSPCESCIKKPCLSACPAKATHATDPFNIESCASHRLKRQSTCANKCLARMACPIAPTHHYTLAQINYHYDLSLKTVKTYFPNLVENPIVHPNSFNR